MLQRLKAQRGKLRLKWMQSRLVQRNRIHLFWDYLGHCAVTLLGATFAAAVYCLEITGHVPAPQPGTLVGFFVAVGGMIGTMIVLLFTLSIIPVQRAADRFSPFVSQLYRDDLTTRVIFFLMAAFCLLSFTLALEGIVRISGPTLVAVEIFVIAFTLDLVRWHQRRVSHLLEPQTAINWLVRQTLADIDKIIKESSRWATLDKIVPGMKPNPSFATTVFHKFAPLESRTDNLAWIAHKAVDNVETYTAQLCVNAMTQIVSHYLTSLQQNEVIRSSIPLLDAHLVQDRLRTFYEHLKDISHNAVGQNNEKVCIQVILALETIASHAANFDAQVFGTYDTTNISIPIGYLEACFENAQRKNMADTVLEASHALKRFAWTCYQHPKSLDIYSVVLEQWYKMALEFSIAGHRPLLNEIIADMMALAHFLIVRKYFLAKEVFGLILGKIEALTVLDLSRDGNSSQWSPLVPYDLMSPVSLFGLLSETVSMTDSNTENESEGPQLKNCGELARFLELVSHHFRNLADNLNVAASFGFLPMVQVIEALVKMTLATIQTGNCGPRDTRALLDETRWLMSFFSAAAQTSAKMRSTKRFNLERACDLLSYFGMSFYQAGFSEFVVFSAKAIASISESYCRATGTPILLDVADLLVHGYKLELAVSKMGDSAAGHEIAQIVSCPESVDDTIRDRFFEHFELRKHQLKKELRQADRFISSKSTQFLRDLMFKIDSNNAPTTDPQ